MDGFVNSKIETQTIYEIYRACRLCGAGAGYKMPIIQNVIDLDGTEVELKQKIRDCVQIEVHQDDKMPPLICELCVDKVNDFYEFLEMCRQTNKRTRLRLGLPPQTMPRGAPDAGDCILGITEPVFINEDASEPSKTRNQAKNIKGTVKNTKSKHQDTKVKITLPTKKETRTRDRIEPRSLRSKQPSPPRLRGTKRSHDDDVSLGSLQRAKRTAMSLPKSILKKVDENSLLTPRSRSSKEKDVKKDRSKKVQLVVKSPPRVKKSEKDSQYKCKICKIQYSNHRSYYNHMRIHANAKPADRQTSSSRRTSSIECHHCKKTFISKQLLYIHTCSAKTVSVNCNTCGRKFASNKAMSNHKSYCVQKKKAKAISPALLKKVKPIQIRISRCDSILESCVNGHYDVSNIPFDYGLDKHCIYPYISRVRIKSEPSYMVNINDEIKEAFDADKYIHWDSEDTASDMDVDDHDTVKKVDSLTSIALKNIFSPKLLGKVPKKRRKVKAEKAFDSILNASDFDSDIRLGIDSIINRLDDTIDVAKDRSGDNDSLFGDDKAPIVTNDDFDALFGDTQNNDKHDDVNKVNDSKENNDDDGDETIENDQSAKNKDDTVSSKNENTVSVENPVNNGEDKSNENDEIKEIESSEKIDEINDNRTVGCSESEHNDKNVESIENNESSKNNDENIVQSDDINEKHSLDLDKLNETESKEMISENESIEKNNDNEQNNKLNDVKEVTDNDQLNDTKVDEKLEENDQNYVDNTSDETLQSSDLKMEEDTEKGSSDNKNDGENVKMTDIRDKNDAEDVTMTESTNKSDAENVTMTESTDNNEVNDVTNTSESTDDKTQQISPNTDNESSVQNDKTYVNGETEVDEKFNMDDLEDVSDSEMDDKKLMDELDAQIGEDERKIIN